MGLFFNDKDELRKDVENSFGKGRNFLIAIKHKGPIKQGIKMIISNFYNTYDSNRTFLLVFDNKGIYEKEISNSDKTDFYLMPESEIENFSVEEKSSKAYIKFEHIGKSLSYEIPFDGRLFKDNKENFNALRASSWQIL